MTENAISAAGFGVILGVVTFVSDAVVAELGGTDAP